MTAQSLTLSALVGVLLCSGCLQFKQDGASCPETVCSSRGTCTYKDTFPTCQCADGYAGVVCSRCAEGFHRAADSSCVADEVCTPGLCGANGVCQVSDGRTVCACVLGYGGALCDSCRAGYHAEDAGCVLDRACTPTSCGDGGTCTADGGRISCACFVNRTGTYCAQHTQSCATSNPCGANGTCNDTTGIVSCTCQPGYSGPTCAQCYPGYSATDAGCQLATRCAPSSCSFAGTCSHDAGSPQCQCNAGYTGPSCNTCATGFHRNAQYQCVADETCASNNRCTSNGTCAVQNGVAVCSCRTGYAGPTCADCYPGYHLADGGAADGGVGCVLDTVCLPETCRFHGTCSADAGVVRCTCETGYIGERCETNIDDCVNSACNGRQCIDLLNSNVCLCDGGVFGQVCP